jgi:hypothetical protein
MVKTKKPTHAEEGEVYCGRNDRISEYEALLDRLLICVSPARKQEVAKLGKKLWRSIPQDTHLEMVHDVALTVAYVAAQALAEQTKQTR